MADPSSPAVHYAQLLDEARSRVERRRIARFFPDADLLGPDGRVSVHAREKYPKHLEFFDAGARYRERCFLAGNRVGKTVAGAYEVTLHLTGRYPPWWTGRRFTSPVKAWAAGKTNETTRDIVQAELLGAIETTAGRKGFDGKGMIPGDDILPGTATWKAGVADLCDTIKVRHVSGGVSILGFKSYQQGRGSFEGTAQHVIWFDEEPDIDVYGEALIRTATTDGIILLTFTPLEGLSETVLQFLPSEDQPASRMG